MQQRTVGVEEEFLLIDPAGTPSAAGRQVVPDEPPSSIIWKFFKSTSEIGDSAGIEHELQQEQAETGTRVRVDLGDLHADLLSRRRVLADAAHRHEVGIAALATSPVPVDPTPTPDPRYLQMMRDYAVTAREQLTCGCHVHVGIDSRAEGIVVVNAIQPWLSVILALSANSPFWQGNDTGYSSYRRMVWDRWPGAGPTAPFADEDEYDQTVSQLLDSQVLLDDGMVYFDARLSAKYPTVEVRVADVCSDPEDAVLVAALCRGLVDAAAADSEPGRYWPRARVELLRGAAWRAARSGLEGDLVDPVTGTAVPAEQRLQQLVDRVAPALRRHGDLELVESSLQRLLREGTGAARQRADYARASELRDVVMGAAERTVAGQPITLGR
jgi:carboxylate-amine ligase